MNFLASFSDSDSSCKTFVSMSSNQTLTSCLGDKLYLSCWPRWLILPHPYIVRHLITWVELVGQESQWAQGQFLLDQPSLRTITTTYLTSPHLVMRSPSPAQPSTSSSFFLLLILFSNLAVSLLKSSLSVSLSLCMYLIPEAAEDYESRHSHH